MEMVTLPPVALSPADETVASWQFVENNQAVDFTQIHGGNLWTAEALLENCGSVVWRGPVSLDAQGGVSVMIPQDVSAGLRSSRRIDAALQLRFFAPLPDFNMVWRAPVSVLEIVL